MIVKFIGFFEHFRTKEPVTFQPPEHIVDFVKRKYSDTDVIPEFVVPRGVNWSVESVDFLNKKVTGCCVANLANILPFTVVHDFTFEDVDIDLNRSATFFPFSAHEQEQSAAFLRSVLDNLFDYHDARNDIINAIIQIYMQHAPKLKSYTPWVDR